MKHVSPSQVAYVEPRGRSPFSTFIAIRYLGGILELPSFWIQTGSIYEAVIKKLLSTLTVLLKDLGVDCMNVFDSVDTMRSDPEGLDILFEAILAGLQSWTLGKPASGFASQYWYSGAWQVLQLLRQYVDLRISGVQMFIIDSGQKQNIFFQSHGHRRQVKAFTKSFRRNMFLGTWILFLPRRCYITSPSRY